MTSTERAARFRARRRLVHIENYPEEILRKVARVLVDLDYVTPDVADKALRFLSYDIDQRRKALAKRTPQQKPSGCPSWPLCGCSKQSGICAYREECERQYRFAGADPSNPDDAHIIASIDQEVVRHWRGMRR
jgi:hypothetical protein